MPVFEALGENLAMTLDLSLPSSDGEVARKNMQDANHCDLELNSPVLARSLRRYFVVLGNPGYGEYDFVVYIESSMVSKSALARSGSSGKAIGLNGDEVRSAPSSGRFPPWTQSLLHYHDALRLYLCLRRTFHACHDRAIE